MPDPFRSRRSDDPLHTNPDRATIHVKSCPGDKPNRIIATSPALSVRVAATIHTSPKRQSTPNRSEPYRRENGTMNDCPLCRAEKLTRRYYEDDVCWVADCTTCKVPMIVLKRHTVHPTQNERDHLLLVVCRLKFSVTLGWYGDMKAIPDHFHVHLR